MQEHFEDPAEARVRIVGDVQYNADKWKRKRRVIARCDFTAEGELGRRHGGYGVEAHHYASVGEAILTTLEERIESFGDRNRAAWGRAYATLADVMISAAAAETVAA
jgi:hypothetical protein